MTGIKSIKRLKIASKTPIRGLCEPESGVGAQAVMAVGEIVRLAGGKVVAVGIRKTLSL